MALLHDALVLSLLVSWLRFSASPYTLLVPLLKPFLRWGALLLVFAGATIWATTRGGVQVSLLDLFSPNAAHAETARQILFVVRGPRILCGLLVGAGLSVSGAALQGAFRNPLAEPYLLGISAGGALGATFAAWARLPSWGPFEAATACAFLGALGAATLVYALARPSRAQQLTGTASVDRATLLLAGVALSAFLSALTSLFVALSGRADLERQTLFWLLGGLSSAPTNNLPVLAGALILGLLIMLASARDLNALRAGDEEAATLGVSVANLQKRLLFAACLLAAACVATAGLVGFVGLLAPHAMRLLFGTNTRALIPASALGGATILVLCDALARSVAAPTEIPLGVVTAILGVPLFLFLARKT